MHLHHEVAEGFYVVDGEVTIFIGDQEIKATRGSFALVPPGVAHTFRFESPEAALLLLIAPGDGEHEACSSAAAPSRPLPQADRRVRLRSMAEELRPEEPFGLQGAYENIWHIAAAERWSDGGLIGHRTYCGRNYAAPVQEHDLAGLTQVCSDCTAQVVQRH